MSMSNLNLTSDIGENLFSKQLITCPHCGHQYLAAEIFYPDTILGKPINTIKDPLGKVLYTEYIKDYEPTCKETYICDACNKPFTAVATVSYKTYKELPETDFSETTVSLID